MVERTEAEIEPIKVQNRQTGKGPGRAGKHLTNLGEKPAPTFVKYVRFDAITVLTVRRVMGWC